MRAINLHNYQFKKLNRYQLDATIMNTECELYILHYKNHWQQQKELLKIFNITNGEYFSNKLYTINSLIDRKDEINIDSLVYPNDLAILDGEIVGYTMPFIEKNINLSTILKNDRIELSKKIELLKEVGLILEKINMVGDLFLGDIHEANFVYDIDELRIKAVDLDSVKIGNNNPSVSKFMTFNHNLWDYNYKYPMNEDDIHIPNKNTTYLCYIYMILNFISGSKIYELSLDKYYDYLQYLLDNGFSKELIDVFSYIYMSKDNKTPLPLLETIPKNVENVLFENYSKKLAKH